MSENQGEELTEEEQMLMDLLARLNSPQIFRKERLITDADMRAEVAFSLNRYIAGDEDVNVETSIANSFDGVFIKRRNRTRTTGSYHLDSAGREFNLAVDETVKETVNDGVMLTAALSAESMIGGAYTHTIGAGVYMRLAAWVDFLAFGGWGEIDVSRIEVALMLIRTMVGSANAVGMRIGLAARYIDDFQVRTIVSGNTSISGATYDEVGDPAGGVTNEN